MAGTLRPIGLALLGATLALAAQAADPTRPPDAWLTPPAADNASAAAPAEGGLRLQSVLIPQHGRPLAIIGGKTVTIGGAVGGQKLIRLNEREAVLQGEDGITHLYLTPEVEKKMVTSARTRPARKAGQAKDLP